MTTQDEIERVHANGTHIVLLGAGATLASTIYRPEKNGKSLPLMWNIVDVIGLKDIVATLPSNLQNLANDFEKLYSTLYGMAEYVHQREEIEKRIHKYFSELELPNEPTIYDYLVLSLRNGKDAIATFNWDPFLY